MDTVKCYAWEKTFQSRVQSVRTDELSWFRSAQFLSAFNSFILNSIPVIMTLVSFGTFTLLGGDLTPAKAFTSLSLFQVLRYPLSMLPNLLSQVVNANISLQRLEELFLAEERILAPNPPLEPGIPAVSIKNGNFSWDLKVRDNILFGSGYEPSQYWKAIDGHDLTEIGERGVNISGGQKQRVSMARAVYSNSDIYIFDDPLSALDAHVGRKVFDSCIKEELQGKTRVLVTNQLHFLPQVDKIILLGEGMIKEEGTFEELSKNGKLFQRLMENAGKMEGQVEEKENGENQDCKSSEPAANGTNELPQNASNKMKGKGGKSVLIKQEERETGVVSWNVLRSSSLLAAKKLHDAMLESILRAPMLFFHTNPSGRIINRFAKDLGEIDCDVASFANNFLGQAWQLLSTFVLIGISTSREVKRLDSITRSPVYAQFGEALNGLSSIRAYKAYDWMAIINGKSMDNNIRFGPSFLQSYMEKLGIVGRTGAGKSSMLNALFRIVELQRGEITIDGCDIAKFGLTDLRKVLSIIPQSPVLFSGTVRFNLDPFSEHNDADLWEALERAHLKDAIRKNSFGLDAEVLEGGENFSVGQRQLLSLARALLRRSKILVLDEATASVDVTTDALIQKTIIEEFRSCIMLIIAHRLNTIIDCDRILVLEAGQVLEHGTPEELLQNEGSAFSRMVQSTGPANAQYLYSLVFESKEHKLCKRKDGQRRQTDSSRWAAAAQLALAVSLASSENGLPMVDVGDEGNVLRKTKDAVITLQDVLVGKHDEAIGNSLQQSQVPQDGWWSAFYRMIEAWQRSKLDEVQRWPSASTFKEIRVLHISYREAAGTCREVMYYVYIESEEGYPNQIWTFIQDYPHRVHTYHILYVRVRLHLLYLPNRRKEKYSFQPWPKCATELLSTVTEEAEAEAALFSTLDTLQGEARTLARALASLQGLTLEALALEGLTLEALALNDSGKEDHNLLDSSGKELDRISELPDCIIQQILSFLPAKDAVKTGVLSSRWAYLWTTIPCLSFRQIDFPGRICARDFIKFINATLMLHRGMNIEKFSLSFHDLDKCPHNKVDLLIRYMTLANVKNLDLDFGPASRQRQTGNDRYVYKLPQQLYSNTCLAKLSLSRCNMKPVGAIRWHSLKILSIGEMQLDDDLMKNVLEGCPLLEVLELYQFHGLNKLIFSNRSLIKFVIRDHQYQDDSTFDISGPYLQSLVMSGDMWMYNYRVFNAKSLVDCSLDFTFDAWYSRGFEVCEVDMLLDLLKDLHHAKELTLGAWFIQVLSMVKLKGMSCPLPECRYLAMDTCLKNWDFPGIACLLENSPSLETLIINLTTISIPEVCFDEDDPLMADAENYWMYQTIRNFKCLMLYLKTIKITEVLPWNFGEFVVPLVHFLVSNGRVLENITVKAAGEGSWKELFQMAQRLLSLPRSSPCSVLKFLEY
ncbi:unnamed protein product [Dovyalis caffra]|uniref:ABC-type xenobiotic transporter n=1 Tax=Dovyalis caffra TaxID=77055 RepID=A0AAV1SGX7_9ROSI|nr:unnamed protein product [Dovyalis caffra]